MAVPYTPRQGQYLAFIHGYVRRHGHSPSEADIATHFMVSPVSAHQMVVTLERRGLIDRVPGLARSLRVLLPVAEIPDLESSRTRFQESHAVEAKYPYIASWLAHGGTVELGRTDHSRSMARALDKGRVAWDGKRSYTSLDELLSDLNEGIARWSAQNSQA